jgi:uncharacterized membrane protein
VGAAFFVLGLLGGIVILSAIKAGREFPEPSAADFVIGTVIGFGMGLAGYCLIKGRKKSTNVGWTTLVLGVIQIISLSTYFLPKSEEAIPFVVRAIGLVFGLFTLFMMFYAGLKLKKLYKF